MNKEEMYKFVKENTSLECGDVEEYEGATIIPIFGNIRANVVISGLEKRQDNIESLLKSRIINAERTAAHATKERKE